MRTIFSFFTGSILLLSTVATVFDLPGMLLALALAALALACMWGVLEAWVRGEWKKLFITFGIVFAVAVVVLFLKGISGTTLLIGGVIYGFLGTGSVVWFRHMDTFNAKKRLSPAPAEKILPIAAE